jgi:hypothetical protein
MSRKSALEAELAALGTLPRKQLLERWRALHGREPPVRIGRGLLIHAIAYELQVRHCGGLSAAAKRELQAIAGSIGKDPKYLPPRESPPRPGTRLIREWGGETHTVTVLEERFEYRGQLFDSLSAIARHITGAHWSGPTFFGLKPGARTKKVREGMISGTTRAKGRRPNLNAAARV